MTRPFAMMRIGGIVSVVITLALLCHAASAQQAGKENESVDTVKTVSDAAEGLADKLSTILKDNDQSEVVLTAIRSSGSANVVAIPLGDALKKRGIKTLEELDDNAGKWRISGDIFKNEAEGMARVKIQCQVTSPDGDTQKIFKYLVFKTEAVADTLGVTTELSTKSDAERDKTLLTAVKNPSFKVNPSTSAPIDSASQPPPPVLSRVSVGPYEVEILVQREKGGPFLPAPLVGRNAEVVEGVNKGQPIIELRPGDIYAIRVINGSPLGAGVEAFVDGVSIFHGCGVPKWKEDGKVYFRPGLDAVLHGWDVSQQTPSGLVLRDPLRFKVIPRKDLEAEYLSKGLVPPDKSSVGVITVNFCAAWNFGEKPPVDEGIVFKDEPATGIGEPATGKKFKLSDGPKVFGNRRAQISIRYSKPRNPADLPPEEPSAKAGPSTEASPKEASPKEASPKKASPPRTTPPGTFDDAIPDDLSANLRKALKAQPATFDETIPQ